MGAASRARSVSQALADEALEAFLAGVAAVDPAKIVKAAVRQGLLDDWLFDGGARPPGEAAHPAMMGPRATAGGASGAADNPSATANPSATDNPSATANPSANDNPAATGKPSEADRPRAADRFHPKRLRVVALGKAAPRMVWGLVEAGVPVIGIGVAPQGVARPRLEGLEWHTGEHPVPGPQSFAAGRALLEWCAAVPPDKPVLVLLSGGASACAEVPAQGVEQDDLVRDWRAWLREPMGIAEMNRRRAQKSAIKGGRLGRLLLDKPCPVRVWALSDVPPEDAPQAVGSGPFFQQGSPDAVPHRVLGSNDDAVAGAGLRLGASGWSVYRHGARIAGDVEPEVDTFLRVLDGLPRDRDVALVGGGEATLALPDGAPKGGRAHHAALVAARELSRRSGAHALFLAAATDGADGGTGAAGAWSDAATWIEHASDGRAAQALERFDAHRFLDDRGQVVRTGATGTNVNDVWIALRRAA